MIGNILKVIAAIIIGFLVGLMSGAILGIPFGLGISLFFREIVFSHQTVLMSIILSSILGALLGLFSIQIINRVAETDDKPFAGIVVGAFVGIIVAIFLYGYIDIPDPSIFEQSFYPFPIFYSVSIGSQIGAIIFPIFGAAAVVRDITRTYAEIRKNKERENEQKNELSFYRSRNSEKDM